MEDGQVTDPSGNLDLAPDLLLNQKGNGILLFCVCYSPKDMN